MTQEQITISDNGTITVNPVNGEIWLSQWQLADFFGVFSAKINSNIKAILKSGILRECDVYKVQRFANGGSVDLYSFGMITALAFRIHSRNAEILRAWIQQRISHPIMVTSHPKPPILIQFTQNSFLH